MQELIDLIIYMGRDEPNQEFLIEFCDRWCVSFVRTDDYDFELKYETKYHKNLIDALNEMVQILDDR